MQASRTEITPAANSTPAVSEYRVERANLQTARATVIDIWRTRSEQSASAEQLAKKFDWFYQQNPQGLAHVYLLIHLPSGSAVGVLGVGVRNFTTSGRIIRAGLLMDYVVSPAHRSGYPALLLQRESQADALKHFDVLYGLPNEKAVPIFKRLGFREAGAMCRYARMLRSRYYLRDHVPAIASAMLGYGLDWWNRRRDRRHDRRSGALKGRWLSDFDRPCSEIAEYAGAGFLGQRDLAVMRWRFEEHPHRLYRIFGVELTATGRLTAYCVCEWRGTIVHIRDILCEQPEAHLRPMLALLADALYAEGAARISIELSTQHPVVPYLPDAGFSQRESRPLFVRWATASAQLGSGPFHLTQADEDV